MDSFHHLVTTPQYIDKSFALKSIMAGSFTKFLFTRPRRWGKTSFLGMTRYFLSMRIDQKTGEEIKHLSFGVFANLKVVTEDRVSIKDIEFLFKRIFNANQADKNDVIEEMFGYFQQQQYPWFDNYEKKLSLQEQLERINRLYENTREAFASFNQETVAQLSKEEIENIIEALRINRPKQSKYYQLLSTFGATCKHYKKYPTIFIEFAGVNSLQIPSGSTYETRLETEIKTCISDAFGSHRYLKKFLKDNSNEVSEDLEIFQSYYLSQSKPDQSLNFLSQQLYNRYKVPTLVLFDEYDKPLNTAYLLGEERYNQVKTCISSVFACLKNENTIKYAFMTGINRFAKADIFSGLNNLKELGILDSAHAECFGFTSSDVKELVRLYNLSNPNQEISYESLKEWYNNYVVDGTHYFNPFSVRLCLDSKGLLQPYWVESGSYQIVLQLFDKIQDGKEEIAEQLRQGEATFCPLKIINWESMKEPTPQMFLSFLLHTGHLSLKEGQAINLEETSTFVVPNKEIKDLIKKQFRKHFYEKILSTKCGPKDRKTIVENAPTNDFTENLHLRCLNKIKFSELEKGEAYFESVIFGIFFMEGISKYQGEVQKRVNEKKLDSIFYPGQSNSQRIALLHEYKVCEQNESEKIIQNALWQCLTKSYLKSLSEGKMRINDFESDWSEVKLRGIAFYKNVDTSYYCASSEEYTLTLDQVKRLLEIFSSFLDKNNQSSQDLLSGIGSKDQVENERTLFLKKNQAKTLSELIQSKPFRYQGTSSKPQASFSTVKHSLLHPLSGVNYPLLDSPVCFRTLSSANSWKFPSLQTSPQSTFQVLDPLSFVIILNFLIALSDTVQKQTVGTAHSSQINQTVWQSSMIKLARIMHQRKRNSHIIFEILLIIAFDGQFLLNKPKGLANIEMNEQQIS